MISAFDYEALKSVFSHLTLFDLKRVVVFDCCRTLSTEGDIKFFTRKKNQHPIQFLQRLDADGIVFARDDGIFKCPKLTEFFFVPSFLICI